MNGNIEKFGAVYLLARAGQGMPLKLCFTSDPKKIGGPGLEVVFLNWVADRVLARKVARETARILDRAQKRFSDEWFSITSDWGERVVRVAAGNLRIPIYTHEEFQAMNNAAAEAISGWSGTLDALRPDPRFQRWGPRGEGG